MVSELTPELDALTVNDKMDLISLLWDSIPEDEVPVPGGHLRIIEDRHADLKKNPDEGTSLDEFIASESPAQLADLEQRIAEYERDPDEGQTWDEVKAELEREDCTASIIVESRV